METCFVHKLFVSSFRKDGPTMLSSIFLKKCKENFVIRSCWIYENLLSKYQGWKRKGLQTHRLSSKERREREEEEKREREEEKREREESGKSGDRIYGGSAKPARLDVSRSDHTASSKLSSFGEKGD